MVLALQINKKLIGSKPQTLKFTQKASVCVLHTNSFNIATKNKEINPSII